VRWPDPLHARGASASGSPESPALKATLSISSLIRKIPRPLALSTLSPSGCAQRSVEARSGIATTIISSPESSG
jgi:hypothetical protein